VVGGILVLAGAYILATAARPSFHGVSGRVADYNLTRSHHQLKLNGQGTVFSLTGDEVGAPDNLLAGTPVKLTVISGTNDVVALRAGGTVPSANWTSPFFYSPEDWAAERRVPGLGLLGLSLLPFGVFAYFRFVHKDPSTELVSRHAQRLAGANYGPRRAEVSALLRHLAALPDSDWHLLGDACFRRALEGRGAQLPVDVLEQAAKSSRRRSATDSARLAAEQLLRQHPPVLGTDGIDLRRSMVEPVGMAAAAVALHDVLSPTDFDLLFGLVGRFVPLAALSNAADPATMVSLP
jgi:hypothetical protein